MTTPMIFRSVVLLAASALAAAAPALSQELTKEFIYVGGRLLAVEVPTSEVSLGLEFLGGVQTPIELGAGQTVQVQANVTGVEIPDVSWALTGSGSINTTSGLQVTYTAPNPVAAQETVTLTATLVNVQDPIDAAVSITIKPFTVAITSLPGGALAAGTSHLFGLAVTGGTWATEAWTSDLDSCSTSACFAGSTFTVPADLCNAQTTNIAVTLDSDPAKVASANVSVVPTNPLPSNCDEPPPSGGDPGLQVVLTSVNPGSQVQRGQSMIVNYAVQKAISTTVTGAEAEFYLSADDVIDAGDTLLLGLVLAPLTQAVTNLNQTVDIPLAAATGNRKIVMLVDMPGAVPDTPACSGNTGCSGTFLVVDPPPPGACSGGELPDLTADILLNSFTLTQFEHLDTIPSVANVGDCLAAPQFSNIIRVAEGIDTFGGNPTGTWTVSSLNPGQSIACSGQSACLSGFHRILSIFIPSTFGTHTVNHMADNLNQVAESQEAQGLNTKSQFFSVVAPPPQPADLQISTLTIPSAGTIGTQVQLDGQIHNAGSGAAAAFRAGYYLSTDSMITPSDILLGTCTVSSLASGATTSCPVSVTLPAGLVGNHYVGLFADDEAGGQINEDLETNNALSGAFFVNAAPQPVSVDPISGSGVTGTFTAVYRDENGAADIANARWLLNGSLTWIGACGFWYNQPANLIHIIDDSAVLFKPGITPGSSSISNSNCTIDGAGVVVSAVGDELSITVPVTFHTPVEANQLQWTQASDTLLASAWVELGSWTIPGVPNQSPQAISMSPASGQGASQTFTFELSDGNGLSDIVETQIVFNDVLSGANACYFRYSRLADKLYLLNDAQTTWGGGGAPGSAVVVENSACEIDLSGVSTSTTTNGLTLVVGIEFKPAFEGLRRTWMTVADFNGVLSPWALLGNFTVNPPYTFRRQLAVPATQVPGAGTHTDFPVLVSGTFDYLKTVANGGKVQSPNGYDIRFATTTGSKLDHEVEKWDAATGELVAWVRLPSLSSSGETFYLYYGNASVAAPEENAGGVWSSEYGAVWHLAEDPATTAPQTTDSTGNGHDGTSLGSMTSGDLVAGKIGSAIDFDGVDDRIQVPDGSGVSVGGVHSFSSWVKMDAWGTATKLYIMELLSDTGGCMSAIWRIGSKGQAVLKQRAGYTSFSTTPQDVESTADLTLDVWTRLDVTADGSNVRFYINGVLDSTIPYTFVPEACANPYMIGGDVTAAQSHRAFDGMIDEMRLVNGATRSADWITTEYNNQNNPAAFVTVGAEEAPGAVNLFNDDFGGDLSAWTIVDEGTITAPSKWFIASGVLQQTENIYGGSADGTVLPKPGTYVLAGQSAWSGYTLSAKLKSTDDDGIGVMFGYQDANNYYRFSMDRQRTYRRLVKVVNGTFTLLAQDSFQFTAGQEYDVEATMSGGTVTIRFDGSTLFSVTDSSHTSGKIALYSWGNTGIQFDDVSVDE